MLENCMTEDFLPGWMARPRTPLQGVAQAGCRWNVVRETAGL
jgi:hypothetical protein